MTLYLRDSKHRYLVPQAWKDLGLPGLPGTTCRSPFPGGHKNGDASPSFSVYCDGRKWKDFATGEGGDVFDLVAKARGCSMHDAIQFVEERLGVARSRHPASNAARPILRIPVLRRGTKNQLLQLCERRGFSVESLELAQERGFLRFCVLWGFEAWCLQDSRQALFEFRRLDGARWPSYGKLHERKAHCVGTGKNWPLGTLESASFAKIAWVEGAPDFLAALHLLLIEGKLDSVAPVAVLGASNHHLAPEALARFSGKRICLFPHLDEAGRRAAREWAWALKGAGAASVRAFDLSGLVLTDGSQGKDLADACRISADCWESDVKFCQLMP